MRRPRGFVYLLHFDRPLSHARHYMGWTSGLHERLAAHRDGRGARLTAVLREVGIGWKLARAWRGGRTDERRLKRRKEAPRLCPICTPRPKDAGLALAPDVAEA